ncbi:MAG TPA: helix-turn-helix domain-containing protein [Terriglobia bacterium]|nr:helix-turn-helix domain-containing protein [Terriglobia bacterium]
MTETLRGIGEAAKLFGVSHFTIRRLIDGGHIRAVNIGARWLIPNAEIERILASGAGVPRRRKRGAPDASSSAGKVAK